ncbi:MAG: hypothetical protein KatS3mg101_0989 [Patescibacteria group bacterium]|nr:MAG: hypothetical protein KatS3mg101_0989 [Patescibacteria group bacterium]
MLKILLVLFGLFAIVCLFVNLVVSEEDLERMLKNGKRKRR